MNSAQEQLFAQFTAAALEGIVSIPEEVVAMNAQEVREARHQIAVAAVEIGYQALLQFNERVRRAA